MHLEGTAYMRPVRLCLAALSFLVPVSSVTGQTGAEISGKVTLTGVPAKPQVIDMSKEPECIKLNPKPRLTEDTVVGPGNTLKNVVVFISAGAPAVSSAPTTPVSLNQQNCHYTTRVLAFQAEQEVKIINSDPLSHNVHPMPVTNREWNKVQLKGSPPLSSSFTKPEFMPVKCNLHPWMRAYFAVLGTSHFAVTGEDGLFTLPDLPPGKYTVTAWHETYGTRNQEITIVAGQQATVDFIYNAKAQ
jgi:plastocyanin